MKRTTMLANNQYITMAFTPKSHVLILQNVPKNADMFNILNIYIKTYTTIVNGNLPVYANYLLNLFLNCTLSPTYLTADDSILHEQL